MHLPGNLRAHWRLQGLGLLGVAALTAAFMHCRGSSPAPVTPADTIFEGTILTMDAWDSVVEAVAIDARGVILGVGKAVDIRSRYAGSSTKFEVLGAKEVLMPGFIEPHTHLLAWMQYNGTRVLSPCYPGPYATGNEPNCSNYIQTSLRTLKPATCAPSGGILFGLDLDPSRQPYDDKGTTAAQFRKSPGSYIDAEVCANQPVLIIDQSGHFGYVNKAAFDGLQSFIASLPACQSNPGAAECQWPPKMPADAAWAPSGTGATDNGKYSGLLIEQDAFMPFMEWLAATDTGFMGQVLRDPAKVINERQAPVTKALEKLRTAGVTTMTSIADSTSDITGITATANLPGSPIRAIVNARFPAFNPPVPVAPPTRAACDPRTDPKCSLPLYLGVTGIKLTSDGSTQGCTAAMLPSMPYSSTGPCATDAFGNANGPGRADYESSGQIADYFRGYWKTGQWRIEAHANGARGMKMVLDAYAQLQSETPIDRVVTLIHATVPDAEVYQQMADLRAGRYLYNGKAVPKLDVRVTHLIGHVPYWGGAFESVFTPEQARNIDPLVAFDGKYGIPFTLHSDTMVSLPFPLWFVQQAVTRDTWYYPQILDAERKVLGPENAISVRDALRAVTIGVAKEKEIDGWVGSIEPGKVADFARLADNPLAHDAAAGGDPRTIAQIKIVGTYLNGKATAPQQ
jgi:hypothetical protein